MTTDDAQDHLCCDNLGISENILVICATQIDSADSVLGTANIFRWQKVPVYPPLVINGN